MTYDTAAEADADRAQQKTLLTALGAWDRALRRDECGAWTIMGEQGTVHTWGDGKTWAVFVGCRAVRHWTATKARLAFCTVTQDGDEEGVLRLHRLASAEEAKVLRNVLGVRKRMEFDPEDLERRRATASRLSQARKLPSDRTSVG